MGRTFLSHFIANNVEGNSGWTYNNHPNNTLKESSPRRYIQLQVSNTLMRRWRKYQVNLIHKYLCDLSAQDDTCTLWTKFVLEDCLPQYFGLFFSTRSVNWSLRMHSIKAMTPILLCVYDVIPRHIRNWTTLGSTSTTATPMSSKWRVCSGVKDNLFK